MELIRFYCINLRRRKDRLSNFINNFPLRYMNNLQIVGAVDASNYILSAEDSEKLKNADWDIQKGKGQWGCSFSHESVWRNMLENKIPYAVILEDDAVFNKNEDFTEFLKMFRLLDLRACYLGPDNHIENTKTNPHKFDDLVCPGICWLKSNLGSMSYFISLEGARDLTEIVNKKGHYRAVDQLINDYMKKRNQWFCISPPCFSATDLGSDIPPST